jgi:60 kDa SS-A/Ro ribonucleoprotein
MSRVNKRAEDYRKDATARTAGGFGVKAAVQSPEALLRRAVLANLLWENLHYETGNQVAEQIASLVPLVEPEIVASIAVQAREEQKLRHVPLFLVRESARHKSHRGVVDKALPRVIQRADELKEFLALYWRDGKQPLAASVKRGLAAAFPKFNAYQLAKYNGAGGSAVKLRDVMFMVHPQPRSPEQAETWKQLAEGTLPVPDTWEVALSRGEDKKATWERLISERKLGALAFLRNLRNMEQVGVDAGVIRAGFAGLNVERLLPLNFVAAARHAPRWQPEIEEAMFRSLQQFPRLPGETVLIVDVSGSMGAPISARSEFTRLDAAAAMAVMAREVCEHVTIWATAGSDWERKHQTAELRAHRGFALAELVTGAARRLGGGGIFTRQALEFVKKELGGRETTRTLIFSDSQDCDYPNSRIPAPFSQYNYIVDVSAHTRGINYDGLWTAEVSGWSERFLPYVAALEAQSA